MKKSINFNAEFAISECDSSREREMKGLRATIVRRVFDTRVPTSAIADHRLQEWTHTELSPSIVQPLISLLLQSAAFKPGFRAFKHLAASAISRGCLIPGILFFAERDGSPSFDSWKNGRGDGRWYAVACCQQEL